MKEVYQCKEKKVLFLKEVISEYFIIASGFYSDEIPFQIVIINNLLYIIPVFEYGEFIFFTCDCFDGTRVNASVASQAVIAKRYLIL